MLLLYTDILIEQFKVSSFLFIRLTFLYTLEIILNTYSSENVEQAAAS